LFDENEVEETQGKTHVIPVKCRYSCVKRNPRVNENHRDWKKTGVLRLTYKTSSASHKLITRKNEGHMRLELLNEGMHLQSQVQRRYRINVGAGPVGLVFCLTPVTHLHFTGLYLHFTNAAQ
ncbi:hypothetical protein HAX54_053357, partial [Datura stramonium]|nr:hypothetical protein [Datura stramonium]